MALIGHCVLHPTVSFYPNEGAEQGQPLPSCFYCKAIAFPSEANKTPQGSLSYRLEDRSRVADSDKSFCPEATEPCVLRTAQDPYEAVRRSAQKAAALPPGNELLRT